VKCKHPDVKLGQVWELYGRLYLVVERIDLGEPWSKDAMWLVYGLESGETAELAALSFGMPRDVLLHEPAERHR